MKKKTCANRFALQLSFFLWMLLSFSALGQIRKGDAFRNRIDSLNKVSFDHPIPVLKMADSMMRIAKKKKRIIDYGLLLQVKGVAETSLGNNTEALGYHMDSYHLFDSIRNNEGKVFAMVNIATVHLNLGNYPKAKDYLFRALAITDKKDGSKLRYIYVNLGVATNYEDKRKAIEYFKKAIPYLMQAKDYNGLAVNYHNIAENYMEFREYVKAEEYELKALDYQKVSGSKSTLAMVSLSLGHLYGIDNRLAKSKYYLEIGGAAAYELQSPYYREIYYEEMANWYEASGDFKNSHVFLRKLIALRDTIHSNETLEANTRIEEQFQYNLKTKEIELLKIQKKLDDVKIERNHFWWIVFLIITLLSLIILIVLYRNYKLKQKANRLLNLEREELAQLNAKLTDENILGQFETLKNQVSPHFLFNSLNALASMIATNPHKAVLFTNAFSKIFRNTLELKDRHLLTLREELQHVNAYLELQKMRFGSNLIVDIAVSSDCLNFYLPPFSLQMVVENAIKHNIISEKEPLQIVIRTEGHFLIITNNLQNRKFVEDSTEIGLKNIQSRYRYLRADEPIFEVRNNEYYVQLPLITEE
ncbi:tetratricopeptide repeat-containing sensor histidine kinase [Flavobacterium sp.]